MKSDDESIVRKFYSRMIETAINDYRRFVRSGIIVNGVPLDYYTLTPRKKNVCRNDPLSVENTIGYLTGSAICEHIMLCGYRHNRLQFLHKCGITELDYLINNK